MDTFEIIRNSFERWYNTYTKDKCSAVINYRDEQTLLIKCYHKITITLSVIGIKNGFSYTRNILELSEHYNHGVTTEDSAKQILVTNFLEQLLLRCNK